MPATDTDLPSTPAFTPLQEKILLRLRAMENDLAKRGLHIVAGAEIEFFAQDENGGPWLKKVSPQQLRSALLPTFPLLEKVYQESEGEIGHYELVFGTKGKIADIVNPDTPYYASVELARQLAQLKEALPHHTKKRGIPRISFEPHTDYSQTFPQHVANLATNGVHINASVVDDKGKNLFKNDHDRSHSALARQSAETLLQLQRDGFALYAPMPQSFKRFGKSRTPLAFNIGDNSLQTSISLRGNFMETYRKTYRMEDRLAGGDVDPLLPLLAGVGAIWHTVCRNPIVETQRPVENPISISSPTVPEEEVEGVRARAVDALKQSALWREIAGEDLFNAIVASQKSNAQSMRR